MSSSLWIDTQLLGVLQDLAGLRMNMLNQNTMKVFKAMSTIYQDHYPVSH